MTNPWLDTPADAPFVVASDRDAVSKFNATANCASHIHTELLPEPYLGRPDAPVLLLNLNPGYDPGDLEQHTDSYFGGKCRSNLSHEASDYPFYLLDPKVEGPGRHWWRRRLKAPLADCGDHAVSQNVFCVEFFPYHSREFHHHRLRLDSQAYGFSLVRAAVTRGALMVVMRSKKLWFEAVPELENYPTLFELRNVRTPAVSPKNCPDGYEAIITAINAAKRPAVKT